VVRAEFAPAWIVSTVLVEPGGTSTDALTNFSDGPVVPCVCPAAVPGCIAARRRDHLRKLQRWIWV
jgi:hypothetical protein